MFFMAAKLLVFEIWISSLTADILASGMFVFQASEKWKGPAWLLKLNLLSFEMSDCFIFTNVFFSSHYKSAIASCV